MTEQDSAYRERVAHMLADEIANGYPLVANSIATIANTIKTSAEVSLKTHQRWTFEEQSLARSAFAGAFGHAPTFGGGFDESASLARERRAFENAAIEAALNYRDMVCGIDTAAGDHAAGKATDEEFIAQSVRAQTDSNNCACGRKHCPECQDRQILRNYGSSSTSDLVDRPTYHWPQPLDRRSREPGHPRWVHLRLFHLQPVRPQITDAPRQVAALTRIPPPAKLT